MSSQCNRLRSPANTTDDTSVYRDDSRTPPNPFRKRDGPILLSPSLRCRNLAGIFTDPLDEQQQQQANYEKSKRLRYTTISTAQVRLDYAIPPVSRTRVSHCKGGYAAADIEKRNALC